MGERPDDDAIDLQLLRSWQAGDARAGEELMRRNYDRVRRFFEIKASFVAEDLTQRTFLACVERAAEIRADSSFRAYLFGIARRQYLMHQRGDGRREAAMTFPDFGGARTKTSLSVVVARREEQQLLLRAMVELPAELLMTLQLYYWEGMKAREIGDAMALPTSTVTSQLSRARKALRDQVEKAPGSNAAHAALLADLDQWARSLAERLEGP
jgi:RNA polymerase sigma factor (sigma-70 family)